METVTADSEKELDTKLKERERDWIKALDSVDHGFNANYGGRGMTGLKLTQEHKDKISKANNCPVTVLYDDGTTRAFSSQKEAAKELNCCEATLSNYRCSKKRNKKGGW